MMRTPSWLLYLLVVCHGLLLFALGQQASDGWAVRLNGSCQAQGLTDCGTTVEPFSACCPLNSYCYDPYNRVCCQSDTNCTASVGKRCAKSEWILCANDGYFCCEQQRFCYAATSSGSDGCGDPGYVRRNGEALLDALVQDDATTISTTASTSASSVTSSSSPSAVVSSSPTSTSPPLSRTSASNTQTTSSKNNAGAIVGGVIGGIAILVLIIGMTLMFRRQYLHAGSKPKRTRSSSAGPWSSWRASQRVAHEVSGTDSSQELDARQMQELDTGRSFHELHDTGRGFHEMQ